MKCYGVIGGQRPWPPQRELFGGRSGDPSPESFEAKSLGTFQCARHLEAGPSKEGPGACQRKVSYAFDRSSLLPRAWFGHSPVGSASAVL